MGRKWREWAYLDEENWPDAIPSMGPKRRHGPYPWSEPDDPEHIDRYPWSHPNAASIGDLYLGDVCPMCGVPLRADEPVVTRDGKRGELWDVSPDSQPVPCYHWECYGERRGFQNRTLDEFAKPA